MINSSKVLDRRQWLRWRASGAVRTLGQDPQYDEYLSLAARDELAGDFIMAAVLHIAAYNIGQGRPAAKKAHRSNTGPYFEDNPAVCEHCGKSKGDRVDGEECILA